MGMKNGVPQKSDKLLDWLNSLPVQTQRLLAERMETTTGQLRQIAYGNRHCNPRLAVLIDKYSAGAVSMVELAPGVDWDHVRLSVHLR